MFNRMDEAIIEVSKSHGKWLEENSPLPSSSADRSVKRNLAFFFNRECNNIVLLELTIKIHIQRCARISTGKCLPILKLQKFIICREMIP